MPVEDFSVYSVGVALANSNFALNVAFAPPPPVAVTVGAEV